MKLSQIKLNTCCESLGCLTIMICKCNSTKYVLVFKTFKSLIVKKLQSMFGILTEKERMCPKCRIRERSGIECTEGVKT